MAKWNKPSPGGGSGATPIYTGVVGETPIYGSYPTGAGVWGESNTGSGVLGRCLRAYNVQDLANSGGSDGVRGESYTGSGVAGKSDGGNGVYGESGNGSGVKGVGPIAGEFVGNVSVTGSLTANDVVLAGADCAEEFDVANAGQLEPGTVVVFDCHGALSHSTEPYDKKVAGVVSGAGKYQPAVILDRRPSSGGRVPIALVGKVYCKVDASYAPIAVGDLLTTSPTSGYAMKATDVLMAFGAVIGKALCAIDQGCGVIPILVALQ